MEKHISQYFEPIKDSFKQSSTSINKMRFILNAAGCPNDKIDSVINGALKDEIQDMIPKEGILVENINELLLQKVTDITDEHRKKLLAYMETNNYIKINKGNVYNIKHGIPNIPVIL